MTWADKQIVAIMKTAGICCLVTADKVKGLTVVVEMRSESKSRKSIFVDIMRVWVSTQVAKA